MKFIYTSMLAVLLVFPAVSSANTWNKGFNDTDRDGNGSPDAGEIVVGAYTSYYAYDANGDDYWDLGDGRILGTVGDPSELDQATLTECDYQVIYRGDFGNIGYLVSGWIKNIIRCKGYDGKKVNHVHVIHESDPRYSGDRIPIWGSWEYFLNIDTSK